MHKTKALCTAGKLKVRSVRSSFVAVSPVKQSKDYYYGRRLYSIADEEEGNLRVASVRTRREEAHLYTGIQGKRIIRPEEH